MSPWCIASQGALRAPECPRLEVSQRWHRPHTLSTEEFAVKATEGGLSREEDRACEAPQSHPWAGPVSPHPAPRALPLGVSQLRPSQVEWISVLVDFELYEAPKLP